MMADDPKSLSRITLSVLGSETAPLIYFDVASSFGFSHGVANITMEAVIHYAGDGTHATRERRVVANLRMNLPALQSLKTAIEGIELLAKPTPNKEKVN